MNFNIHGYLLNPYMYIQHQFLFFRYVYVCSFSLSLFSSFFCSYLTRKPKNCGHNSDISVPLPIRYRYGQGYFCGGTHWNTVPEVFSQNNGSQNGVPEPLFPGIDIINTPPLQPNFVSLCILGSVFFLEKQHWIWLYSDKSQHHLKCYISIVALGNWNRCLCGDQVMGWKIGI